MIRVSPSQTSPAPFPSRHLKWWLRTRGTRLAAPARTSKRCCRLSESRRSSPPPHPPHFPYSIQSSSGMHMKGTRAYMMFTVAWHLLHSALLPSGHHQPPICGPYALPSFGWTTRVLEATGPHHVLIPSHLPCGCASLPAMFSTSRGPRWLQAQG